MPGGTMPASEAADTIATGAGEVAAAFSAPVQEKTEPEKVAEPQKKVTPAKQTTTKKTAAKTTPKATTHTVKRGENLSKIAKRYGVTVQAIKKANNLKNDNINAGQKIKIPQ